jgi:hypothetical protein
MVAARTKLEGSGMVLSKAEGGVGKAEEEPVPSVAPKLARHVL